LEQLNDFGETEKGTNEANDTNKSNFKSTQRDEPNFGVEVRSMLFCIPITALARNDRQKPPGM
jgi:hypothetical protein